MLSISLFKYIDLNINFKPVVPLPPKVDAVTGEENEKLEWSSRAKLYRFTGNEWKERGIGEIKLLHDEVNDRYRLVMRRDQVQKVCLNQYINKEMALEPRGVNPGDNVKPKSYTWGNMDFSEGEATAEIFAVRFKNEEIAENFLTHVTNCQSKLNDS